MTISFARHQFPPAIIRHAVWLYMRFTLSYRDVEDLLAERGLDISYETVRRWVLKFGPLFARELRRRRQATVPNHIEKDCHGISRGSGGTSRLYVASDHRHWPPSLASSPPSIAAWMDIGPSWWAQTLRCV